VDLLAQGLVVLDEGAVLAGLLGLVLALPGEVRGAGEAVLVAVGFLGVALVEGDEEDQAAVDGDDALVPLGAVELGAEEGEALPCP